MTSKVAAASLDTTLKSILLTFCLRDVIQKNIVECFRFHLVLQDVVLKGEFLAEKKTRNGTTAKALIKKTDHVQTFGFDITCVIFFSAVFVTFDLSFTRSLVVLRLLTSSFAGKSAQLFG